MTVTAEGFNEFVVGRSTRLLRTANLLTQDWALAEDLLQSSLVKAWSAWLRIEGDPEAYVRRILVNTHASWWRRRWRSELPSDVLPELPADGDGDPHGRLDERDQLWSALHRLWSASGPFWSCAISKTSPRQRSPTPWVARSAP